MVPCICYLITTLQLNYGDDIYQILLEYLKLVELAIIMVLGSVEDEKTFFNVNFLKSKFWNRLTIHLGFVVRMFAQISYDLNSFPFYIAIR
jgi:hypothetical protein